MDRKDDGQRHGFLPASVRDRERKASLTRCLAAPPQSGRAPVITIFDHRGCNRGGPNKEYTGPKSGDSDDEMCVKVALPIIQVSGAQSTAQVTLVARFPQFRLCRCAVVAPPPSFPAGEGYSCA
jgi:hypothetical protein